MTTKLKPCPFCGGDAEMHITNYVPVGKDYTPRCKNPFERQMTAEED